MTKKDVHLRIGGKTFRGEIVEDARKQYAVVTSGEESIEECLLIYAKDLEAAIDKYFWIKASAIDYGMDKKGTVCGAALVKQWTKEVVLVGKDKAVWSGAPGESFTTIARLEDVEFPDPVKVVK